jgi:hypothetical protein
MISIRLQPNRRAFRRQCELRPSGLSRPAERLASERDVLYPLAGSPGTRHSYWQMQQQQMRYQRALTIAKMYPMAKSTVPLELTERYLLLSLRAPNSRLLYRPLSQLCYRNYGWGARTPGPRVYRARQCGPAGAGRGWRSILPDLFFLPADLPSLPDGRETTVSSSSVSSPAAGKA